MPSHQWTHSGKSALFAMALPLLLAGCERQETSANTADSPQETFEWRMVTSWPPGLPGLGTTASEIAERIGVMSGGRLTVKVYGAGELVPGLEVFDAVSSGSVEMGHSAAYYWRGKLPAAAFYGGIPFGLTTVERNAWLYHAGGLELWHELYAPYNLIAFPAGNTGPQWGGWFRKKIRNRKDLQGLAMRIPGLGGEVINRMGVQQVQLAGGEIYTALETGTLDAAEWANPFSDLSMGFHQIAPFYYYPGWQEMSVTLELSIHLDAWKKLPDDLKAIVEAAARVGNDDLPAFFTARGPPALEQLAEQYGVEVLPFPRDVLHELRKHSEEAVEELAASDPMAGKVHASWSAFRDRALPFRRFEDATVRFEQEYPR